MGVFYCLIIKCESHHNNDQLIANDPFPILTKSSALNTLELYLKINKIA